MGRVECFPPISPERPRQSWTCPPRTRPPHRMSSAAAAPVSPRQKERHLCTLVSACDKKPFKNTFKASTNIHLLCVCCVCVCVGKDSPGSESDGADSRSETGSEIQPKKVINHTLI